MACVIVQGFNLLKFIIVVDILMMSFMVFNFFLFFLAVPQSYVPGADTSRQRHHAPLYGRLVSEEHLPAAHRDVHLQVSFFFLGCYN